MSKPNKKSTRPSSSSSSLSNTISYYLTDVHWSTAIFMIITHILSIYGVLTIPFNWKTYTLAFVGYYLAGIGITAGYHRLFSHRSYDAVLPVRIVLTLLGTTAFEMSALEWCKDHRAHHRFTDTDKDPYNIKRGFWWAHIGWLIYKRKEEPMSDISDLQAQWFLRFQDKYFLPLAFFFGFGVPTLIAGYFWGDWWGGFVLAGVLSKVLTLECTFCINSVAHWIGEATYSDQRTPRDSVITSLLTFGEGYHNFHHEFPYDYRNGVKWLSYDPGKWVIAALSYFGLTYNLKRFPSTLFEKGEIHMAEKKLEQRRSKLFWGKPEEDLPMYTREMVATIGKKREKSLIIIEDTVYDITEFMATHPGGSKILAPFIGKDATSAFNGAVYNHSVAARHLLGTMRMAKIARDVEQ